MKKYLNNSIYNSILNNVKFFLQFGCQNLRITVVRQQLLTPGNLRHAGIYIHSISSSSAFLETSSFRQRRSNILTVSAKANVLTTCKWPTLIKPSSSFWPTAAFRLQSWFQIQNPSGQCAVLCTLNSVKYLCCW